MFSHPPMNTDKHRCYFCDDTIPEETVHAGDVFWLKLTSGTTRLKKNLRLSAFICGKK